MPRLLQQPIRWLRSRRGVALTIGLLFFAATMIARELGWLVSWELGAYDNYLRQRPVAAAEPPVSLVWIREQEIAKFGHPLPDEVLARALREIVGHAPRAVGVDVYRDRPVGSGWEELREVFLANPNIVIVEKLADPSHPAVGPPPFLKDRNQVGFADIAPDPDGVTRRGLLMLWEADEAYTSFSLRLALRYLYAEGLTMGSDPENEFIRLGQTTIPPFERNLGGYKNADAGGYQYLLDYRRANGSFPSANLSEVLDGEVDPALLRDRVVVIGTASPSVKDNFQAPSGFIDSHAARVYGAEQHAQAIDQLTRFARGESRPLGSLSEVLEGLWILAWCLASAFVGIRVRSPVSLVLSILVGLGVLLGGGYLAFLRGWWLPVVPVAVGGLGSLGVSVAYMIQQERADKLKAMNLFGRFVSRKLVDRIWEDRDLFMEGDRPRPQRITVTVMLTDLIGYTTRSEKKEPAEVMEWLGTYMDRMAYLVESHGGMVNDFLGDGLMASFGVPVASTTEDEIDRDARSAVDCAMAMGRVLAELNEAWQRSGEPTARMRVGIFTGPGVVGAIGSAERMKYATVGNTVNTASRLESFDKMTFELEPEHGTCRILVGQPTLDRLGDGYLSKCVGSHVLKGKGEPVMIHRILGRAADVIGSDAASSGAGV
jgi:adenylate cyclase